MDATQKAIEELLQNYRIGETTDELAADNSSDLRLIHNHMARQAKRSLHIVSRRLDKELFDNKPFISAVTQLVRRSKYSFIQILVQDASPAVKNGHRLITLSQQLTSYIKIKQLHNDYKEYTRAFIVVDEKAYILREAGDRFEATINYNAPLAARELVRFFNDAWEISEPDPQLRRLHI